jgi:hypothetical protein
MLHTPLQSPITRVGVDAPSRTGERRLSAASSGAASSAVASGGRTTREALTSTAPATATTATSRAAPSAATARGGAGSGTASVTLVTPRHGTASSSVPASPLHVDDVGVSVRLMQCLGQLKPTVKVQDAETRFVTSLRTTTQRTINEHWQRRMESAKAARAAKLAEVHQRTQTHQLFKRFAFQQRMAARSGTPSAAAAVAAIVSTTADGAVLSRDGPAPPGAPVLFPTTPNSLTRAQVEDFFAVPSFVRPLLTLHQPVPPAAAPEPAFASHAGYVPMLHQHQHHRRGRSTSGGV